MSAASSEEYRPNRSVLRNESSIDVDKYEASLKTSDQCAMYACQILESQELLTMHAHARNTSIPQIRRRMNMILAGVRLSRDDDDDVSEGEKMDEDEDEDKDKEDQREFDFGEGEDIEEEGEDWDTHMGDAGDAQKEAKR